MKMQLPFIGFIAGVLAATALGGCVTIHNTYTGLPPGTDGATPVRRDVARADCGCPGGAPTAYPPYSYAPPPYYPTPTSPDVTHSYYPWPYPTYAPPYYYPGYPTSYGPYRTGAPSGTVPSGTAPDPARADVPAGTPADHRSADRPGVASTPREPATGTGGQPTAADGRRPTPEHDGEKATGNRDTRQVGSGLPHDNGAGTAGSATGAETRNPTDVADRAHEPAGPVVVGGSSGGKSGGSAVESSGRSDGTVGSSTRNPGGAVTGPTETPANSHQDVGSGVANDKPAPADVKVTATVTPRSETSGAAVSRPAADVRSEPSGEHIKHNATVETATPAPAASSRRDDVRHDSDKAAKTEPATKTVDERVAPAPASPAAADVRGETASGSGAAAVPR